MARNARNGQTKNSVATTDRSRKTRKAARKGARRAAKMATRRQED